MNNLEENHEDELSVFTPPLTNTGVHTRQWIEYRPTNQISGESPLEFLIPPQSVGYMDLRRGTLKIKLRLTNALGQPVAKRRQRRIGQSSLTSRLFASGLQSPTDLRYAHRNQLPVQSPTSTRYWRRVPTTECYGTRNSSRRTRLDTTTT